MVEDVVRNLGYGTLGSRLKRIGEKLQAQTQEVALELTGTDLPTPHYPVLAALDRTGPMSIGDLAKALGQTQPGVTRMINKMKSAGLVEAKQDDNDKRISNIALTGKGEAKVVYFKQALWPTILLAVKDACSDLDGSFLNQLTQLEDALTSAPLMTRLPEQPVPDWDHLTGTRETNS
ncbi:MarR family winged helix-turn-helix transcriptional regulator [Roseibium sp. SCP14]|uniref:MarR family winged helix-turn-helix transcriptional regulator n=1 Tax=Roseibium sp. SCP14 TaxID=3141375 RepID=UPI00333AFD77